MRFKLLLISCVILLEAFNVHSQKKVDSLLLVLKNAKHDSVRFNALYSLGDELEGENPDTSLYFYNAALKKGDDLKDELKKAKAIYAIGRCFEDKSDYAKALENYNQSIIVTEKYISSTKKPNLIKAKKILTSDYNAIGIVYMYQSDYSKTLDYFFKALKINDELKDKSGQAINYGNIGIVYYNQLNFFKALDYYFKALKINEELKDKKGQAIWYGNIGLVYSDQAIDAKNRQKLDESNALFNKALDYYFRALKIEEEMGNKNHQAHWLGNIGIVYSEQANEAVLKKDIPAGDSLYKKSIDHYFKALKIDEEVGNKQGQAIWLGNIGGLYFRLNKYMLAEKYLNQAIKIGEELKIIYFLEGYYNVISDLYDKTGRPKQALEAYKKCITCRDSIMSEENKKASIQKEMQYQFDKKAAMDSLANAKTILIKNAQLKEQKAVSSRQKLTIIFVIAGLLLVIVFSFIVVQRLRITHRQKRIIESQKKIVDEKNKVLDSQNQEITAQRDEIKTQRDEIAEQRDMVIKQKEHIEEIHKELTDSINYAERIQRSFLATRDLLNEYLNDYFVFYKPKDVVSGDFYWAGKLINNNFVIAVGDSTGHGVPGAIMSILNITSLEKAVEQGLFDTSKILNETRKTIIERLKKDGTPEGGKDGMDASLLCFDFNKKRFNYSAANNPVWVIRENLLIELDPDKMPVGKHDKDNIPFTQREFELQNDDVVYLLTDGLPDQFGGPKGKKFKYAQLKDLLLSIHTKPMEEQYQIIEKTLQEWKGELEQVDDITIMGIRI